MPKNTQKKKIKVALVHDYLAEFGGAERVLEQLKAIFPDAPVYTAFLDKQRLGPHWQRMKNWDIRLSWLSKIPFHQQLFSPLRIFAPQYFRAFDLSAYDLVISSTNAYFAKAIRVPNGRHFCYCHTPSRSLWGYSTMTDWRKNPLIRFFGTLINHYLRVVDYYVAQDVDQFIANSKETARRIKKFYKREAVVIYPPIKLPTHPPKAKQKRQYFLYVNRLAFAKHPELAVAACTKLNLPLKVVGEGKLLPELERIAGSTIEFVGHVDDRQLADLYAGAKALLYPVEDEDFGMVPVEAMGYGVPVIAHNSGGPKETVIEGKTGILFDDLSVDGLLAAIEKFNRSKFSAKTIWQWTNQFPATHFDQAIKKLAK